MASWIVHWSFDAVRVGPYCGRFGPPATFHKDVYGGLHYAFCFGPLWAVFDEVLDLLVPMPDDFVTVFAIKVFPDFEPHIEVVDWDSFGGVSVWAVSQNARRSSTVAFLVPSTVVSLTAEESDGTGAGTL